MEKILKTSKSKTNDAVSRFWTKIGLMAEITSLFRNAPPKKTTYEKALNLIQRVIPFEAASLYLNNPNHNRLIEVVTCGDGFKPEEYKDIQPDFIEWATGLEDSVKLDGTERQGNTETALVVPLIVEKKLIGVIAYVTANNTAFRENDYKLLAIIGDHLALSIERMIYQKRLEEKNKSLIKARDELKKMQADLINNERLLAVKQLAVSINHEINNPLSVITGNVEYIQYLDKELSDTTRERLKIIESESKKIAEINRRLLDIHTLVSEQYIDDDERIQMLNLEESASGEAKNV
jgi:K+-sensing histidine kinase KdpD